jgi:hypothetical protein
MGVNFTLIQLIQVPNSEWLKIKQIYLKINH